nr:MAG TPA: hypothetical protein [Caudoviricetes sp.]
MVATSPLGLVQRHRRNSCYKKLIIPSPTEPHPFSMRLTGYYFITSTNLFFQYWLLIQVQQYIFPLRQSEYYK